LTDYDVFNGDADGICALLQLRQVEPRNSVLVTGVKRDVELLSRITAEVGDRITVLDISMKSNFFALERLLSQGAAVFYVDHHATGVVPVSSSLISILNQSANISTSLLVNQYLRGVKIGWAVVGTFGDNLKETAFGMLKGKGYSSEEVSLLEKLGIYLNYNGYGADLSDLHYDPSTLYELLLNYMDPLEFINNGDQHYQKLEAGYHQDLSFVNELDPIRSSKLSAVFMLPDEAWARRVSGVFGNDLANKCPAKAHAVITKKPSGNYLVSVRAPLSNKRGAGELCSEFPTGGGREAAAGINNLPADELTNFIDRFELSFKI
jgi:hypothetical protein